MTMSILKHTSPSRAFITVFVAVAGFFMLPGCSRPAQHEGVPASKTTAGTVQSPAADSVEVAAPTNASGSDLEPSGVGKVQGDVESDVDAPSEGDGAVGTITVNITSVRSAKGQLIVCLYNGADGFPADMGAAWKRVELEIQDAGGHLEFSDVPHGEYALWIAHDENGNGEVDANLIGIPKEGVGVSNNAKGRFGPPAYKDARFQLDGETHSQEIEITYF